MIEAPPSSCGTTRIVTMLRVLANATRLSILKSLAAGEKSVAQIEAALCLGQPNLSQQLAELRMIGAVTARRDGKSVYYCLRDVSVHQLIDLLPIVAGENSEHVKKLQTMPLPSTENHAAMVDQ